MFPGPYPQLVKDRNVRAPGGAEPGVLRRHVEARHLAALPNKPAPDDATIPLLLGKMAPTNLKQTIKIINTRTQLSYSFERGSLQVSPG